jgi:flagellar motor switch protein FliG
MKMKHSRLWSAALGGALLTALTAGGPACTLAIWPAAAQVAAPAALPPAGAGESAVLLEQVSYEKLLEESLKQSIASYLGDNRFIVVVRARMTRTGGQPGSIIPGVAQPYQPVLTTTLPGIEPAEDLPGLPAPPGQAARGQVVPPPPNAAAQAVAVPAVPGGLRIDQLRVKVLVDKEIKAEEKSFLESLISQKSDANFARGDEVKVEAAKFRELPQGLQTAAVTGTAVLASGSMPAIAGASGAPPAGSDPWRWVLLAVLGVLALLVLGLLAALLMRRQAPVAAPLAAAMPYQGQGLPPGFVAPNTLLGAQTAPPTIAAATTLDDTEKKAEREAAILRQELVVMLLEYPDLAATLFRDLLKKEDGARKGAIVLRALGMQSSSRLFTTLGADEWGRIEAEFPAAREASPEETKEAIEEAYQAMVAERAAALAVGNTRKNSPFGFLEKLDDSQILFILQDEGLKVRALVLSQLPFKRAAALIKKWPVEDQGNIATALGELEAIPVTTFQNIADKLAQKAAQAPSFSAVLTDGVNLLVNILDNADSTTEQRILDTLKTQNPTMMRRVKELYLTFADVPRIPSAVIKDALREMDPSTIAVAIRDAEEPLQDAILNAMADRRRALLMDAMEMLESQPAEPQQVEEARRELVARVRDLIKQGRFSMKTLAEG